MQQMETTKKHLIFFLSITVLHRPRTDTESFPDRTALLQALPRSFCHRAFIDRLYRHPFPTGASLGAGAAISLS